MTRRLPPFSALLAIVLVLLLLLWLAFGDLQRFKDEPPDAEVATEQPDLERVEVITLDAEAHTPRLILQGQLEAHRELELRARQAGRVAALPVTQGSHVEAGQVLLELAEDELPERLEQAEAALALARAELAGGSQLRERQLISNPEYLRLQSQVATAVADLAGLLRQLADTRPEAPFDGVLDRLDVELGELVQVGETWGRLVDDSRLTASAAAAQRDALSLAPGLSVDVRTLDGSRLTGTLTHIASRADEQTRSFAVEVSVDNPERRRLAGASASLEIALPERRLHRFSPALLVLDDQGDLAVKHLDDQDRVKVTSVELVEANAEQAWVAGLPDTVRLITLGGGFVESGERVDPVEVESAEPGERDDSVPTGEMP
ncbi:efflux RND transporter periplasmic adaptor subunit [Halomonas urumqiensis]|uniref:Efflux RND transporter periplasmic adaptor subunit n=1 Tax=Halomonas urumqiensis TaxID=1684789 RepID=A0A2N7UDW2_9GAMM|nr:efflux RND transporter periplasmic adaptor subunit [Halomonas urumqiensis]PMR78634.1 efflux RND transporter periplasmic adaptor subunit [Halomonas urumqiensis]PTB04279.1 efflux RND transporter periplasmic adaptor subunit [Halomonas urumqiensis]